MLEKSPLGNFAWLPSEIRANIFETLILKGREIELELSDSRRVVRCDSSHIFEVSSALRTECLEALKRVGSRTTLLVRQPETLHRLYGKANKVTHIDGVALPTWDVLHIRLFDSLMIRYVDDSPDPFGPQISDRYSDVVYKSARTSPKKPSKNLDSIVSTEQMDEWRDHWRKAFALIPVTKFQCIDLDLATTAFELGYHDTRQHVYRLFQAIAFRMQMLKAPKRLVRVIGISRENVEIIKLHSPDWLDLDSGLVESCDPS